MSFRVQYNTLVEILPQPTQGKQTITCCLAASWTKQAFNKYFPFQHSPSPPCKGLCEAWAKHNEYFNQSEFEFILVQYDIIIYMIIIHLIF